MLEYVKDFFVGLLALILDILGVAIGAFLFVALCATIVVSFGLSFLLIAHLICGNPIPWYEIASPFCFFISLGIYVICAES